LEGRLDDDQIAVVGEPLLERRERLGEDVGREDEVELLVR
jgi:hypothetical protein